MQAEVNRKAIKSSEMDKLHLKKALVEACRKIKNDTEINLRTAVKEAEQSANEYGQPKDRYDSYREQLSKRRDMLALQLIKVQEELTVLDRIDLSRLCDKAGFGAVVHTGMQKVFISTGIGKVKAGDGNEYFAISPAVPFAKAVQGKKAGDTAEFNGKKISILDVF